MALTAQQKAQRGVDRVQEKLDQLGARRDAALAKVRGRYSDEEDALKAELEHAKTHPALVSAESDAAE